VHISNVYANRRRYNVFMFDLFVTNKLNNRQATYKNSKKNETNNTKLAPYGIDGRLFTTDVSANFKVT